MDNTITTGYKPNTVLIGYNPNDFFYSNAASLGNMPSDDKCNELKPYDDSWNNDKCKPDKFPNNSIDCINVELCKNKNYANKLMNINKGNANSDEKYYNVKEQYDILFMNSINLGIGCVFLFWFIFKNR
uniref:Uncharacterized protein n=1 Tax=viral metagenome TaxID=1070528 RepID=A0A6C0DBR1_9ZZZZ